MARAKVEGPCSICGKVGPLSYEHVPPEAAFNEKRVLIADIKKVIGGNLVTTLENPKGKINQRGAGEYTLCESCNSNTGHWYGGAYVDFVSAIYDITGRLPAFGVADIAVECKPQNILKQIVAMFCSACGPSFAAQKPDLVRYLLNPDQNGLPIDIAVWMAMFDRRNSKVSRQSGISGRMSFDSGESNTYSEISFPPLNLVMTLGSLAPDDRLFDVTWFDQYRYNKKAWVPLKLHCLPVNSYLPCDYRLFDELKAL